MRILMVLDKPFPPDLRVENEARSLARAGHEVHVLSVGPPESSVTTLRNGVVVRHHGTPRMAVSWMRALAATWPFTRWFYRRKIEEVFRAWPFDAVHVHDLYLAGAGRSAAERLGVLLVVDLHEHWTYVLDDYAWSSGFPRRWIVGRRRWRRFERTELRGANAVVVVSSEMARDYRYVGRPILTVPNYVSLENGDSLLSDANRSPEGVPTILYAGGLVPNRGLDTAVEAMPGILESAGPVRLLIVGDGVRRSGLERRVRDLGIEDAVHFTGWVPQREVSRYIIESDICINLLRRSGQTDVALSHKLYQYMLGARPVIVTDCPAMARSVLEADAGIVVPDRDVTSYTEAVLRLLDDRELAERYGSNGREAVIRRFNWDEAVQPLLGWYAEKDSG